MSRRKLPVRPLRVVVTRRRDAGHRRDYFLTMTGSYPQTTTRRNWPCGRGRVRLRISYAAQQISIPELQEVRRIHTARAVEIQGRIIGRNPQEHVAECQEIG